MELRQSTRIAILCDDLLIFAGRQLVGEAARDSIRRTMYPQSVILIRRLHESTRRRWCRMALVCLAFSPLGMLIVLSLVVATPWYRDWEKWEWERRVSRTLGIDIEAGEFRWTAPYQFHAEQVELRHPETHALLGRIGGIDGLMKVHGWSVILDQPVIDGEQLDSGMDLLHDWFLCRPQTSSHLLALAIPNGMTIHHGVHKTSFHRIDIVFRPSERMSAIQAKWQLQDQPFGEVSLQVSREHSQSESTTRMELSSPSTWIPCSIAKDRFPFWSWTGEDASFRGVIQYQESARTWDAMLTGELQAVDMGGLTSSLGAPIQGAGSLAMERLQVRDGRILKAAGEVRVQGGKVNRKWLQRVAEHLRLPVQWQQELSEVLPIEQAGCRFDLDPSGLRLEGTLPSPTDWPPIAVRLGASTVCANNASVPIDQLIIGLQSEGAKIASLALILPLPESAISDRKGSAADSLRFRLSRNGYRDYAK